VKAEERERPASEVKPRTEEPQFSEIYATWHPRVRRWVSSLGAPAGDIDDVTQEVFIIVRRKLSDFHGGNIRSWLFRITELTVRDFRRKAWFRRAQHGNVEQVEKLPVGREPEGLYETRQSLKRVADALTRMSATHREIFVLFAIQGSRENNGNGMGKVSVS
jgi:RNA polymerase sigma-70 factor (ECF subfamily)